MVSHAGLVLWGPGERLRKGMVVHSSREFTSGPVCERSSMAEFLLPKQDTRVRFPSFARMWVLLTARSPVGESP